MDKRSYFNKVKLTWYALAVLLAVLTYFYALDSQHVPKNGDEYPYAHITRLTAASGHLLPLQSQLDGMRNTKPPLLFWQGIASTSWGKNWTLWDLRWPSVVYTLLTALLVFLLAQKISRRAETGFIALLAYLAFFSTYRYGRPFLVNPAEVFWFFLPFFALLYWRPVSFESRWLLPVLMGMATGVGVLYKSFALVAPVGLCLAWWYLHQRGYRLRDWLRQDALKVMIVVVMALGLFALWFVLDPDPQAVWREFVVGENAGKFDPRGNWLLTFLWGGSSVWTLLLGFPINAGLLALPVLAVCYVSWRRRAQLTGEEKLLWIWMAAFFIVFSLPSQRSARYLLEAMPGLAVLCALNWGRISRKIFVATLVPMGVVLAVFAVLALRLQQETASELYAPAHWFLLAAVAVLILVGLFVPRSTAAIVNVAAISVLMCFAAFMRPLDGAAGNFSAETQRYAAGRQVWVPYNFNAKEEGHRFLLPGADVHGYRQEKGQMAPSLAARYRLFVFQVPLQDAAGCANCRVVGERLNMRSRHSNAEIKAMLAGDVSRNLFMKELLIEVPDVATDSDEDGSR